MGVLRYLGTISYLVSDCAGGDFELYFENFSDPPVLTDITGFTAPGGGGTPVPFHLLPTVLRVETQGCCHSDSSCEMLNATCCENQGGVPQGPGTVCEGDADGDGIDGVCGDVCLGFDDRIDDDNDGMPDCLQTIPTVSTWGLVILALSLLTLAKVSGRVQRSGNA
ncbi:MAG: hypothetical protein AABZ47_11870 [Planctomycetota bacterium]